MLLDYDIAVARLALSAIKRHEASQEVLVARLKRVEGMPAARLLLAAVQVKIRCRVALATMTSFQTAQYSSFSNFSM